MPSHSRVHVSPHPPLAIVLLSVLSLFVASPPCVVFCVWCGGAGGQGDGHWNHPCRTVTLSPSLLNDCGVSSLNPAPLFILYLGKVAGVTRLQRRDPLLCPRGVSPPLWLVTTLAIFPCHSSIPTGKSYLVPLTFALVYLSPVVWCAPLQRRGSVLRSGGGFALLGLVITLAFPSEFPQRGSRLDLY